MKIDLHVDCSPEEARRFFGLPDVTSLQASVMRKLEQRTLEAADAFAPEAMLRNWLVLFPQSQERLHEMVSSFFRPRS
jgi:hypothetical protein